MIHDEICTYEVCQLAKEKGFQLDCIGYYDFVGEYHFNYESAISNKERTFCHNKYNNIWHRDLTDAPTQSLMQRWLREEKRIHISVEYEWVEGIDDWTFWSYIKKINNAKVVDDAIKSGFNTYELALEDALKYALENLV